MKFKTGSFILITVFLMALLFLFFGSPITHMGGNMMRNGMGMMSMMNMAGRHHKTIPAEYSEKSNPLIDISLNTQEGEVLYLANCAVCHGDKGDGDGLAGKELDPRPADIGFSISMGMNSDPYL